MKKRTDEEKREMIDKACDLFNEANEKIIEGKRLMHLCGIELCGGFDFKEGAANADLYESNLHIHSGIKKLEKLTGQESFFTKHFLGGKPDLSRLNIRYKGLLFMQLGVEKAVKHKEYTFR